MKNKAFQISISMVLVGLFLFVGFRLPTEEKTAYVLTGELYEGFTMKQELEAQISNQQALWKNELDSLKIQLEQKARIYQSLEEENVAMLRELQAMDQLLGKKTQRFEEQNAQTMQAAYDQIWNQLNTYIQEYGEEHGYKFIYGANGDGSIMYADPVSDLTEKLIEYTNQKYAGQ